MMSMDGQEAEKNAPASITTSFISTEGQHNNAETWVALHPQRRAGRQTDRTRVKGGDSTRNNSQSCT